MKPEPARFALVTWPNGLGVGCIYLHAVEDAVKRGAMVIAVEDEELCMPPAAFTKPAMDMTQLSDRRVQRRIDNSVDDERAG